MSFEGYYRLLCEDGHLTLCDVYSDYPEKCGSVAHGEFCNKQFVWENTVDQTNGVDEETGLCPGEFPLQIDHEKVITTCECCGETKLISDYRYKIPTNKGRKHNPNEEWG
jgi:hypothetical protein